MALTVVIGPRIAFCQTTHATPAARLVSALTLLDSRRGTEALDELRNIVDGSPTWETARLALGSTLLRRGLFAEARSEYSHVVGQSTVTAIENGDGTQVELTPAQMDALFGVAICRDQEGAIRRADRLYRGYADRMGLASPGAARAFYRLAVMFERVDVPWADADAERARALALDPGIANTDMLPPLPDPAADARTEPYTRVIQFIGTVPSADNAVPSADDTVPSTDDTVPSADNAEAAIDDSTTVAPVPPALASYVEPWSETARGDSLSGGEPLDIELLVNADGTVEDVHIDDCDSVDCSALVDLTFAAAHWLFAPATVDGEPVAARILFPVPHHGTPAASSVGKGENTDEGEEP